MNHVHAINGLPLPQQLIELVAAGRWRHPGDSVLQSAIPFLRDPVDFLESFERIERESSGLVTYDLMALGIRREHGAVVCWPMLDGNRAILIAVCRFAGDDVAIALDYREDANVPRVVASHWHDSGQCEWQIVAPTFAAFVQVLEALSDEKNYKSGPA
jgi:hypothetical protein